MNKSEQPLPIKTLVFSLFMVLFVFLSMLQSVGCLPEKTNYAPTEINHKYDDFHDDEEKLIYELLKADGYSHDEARDGVVNSRGVYN